MDIIIRGRFGLKRGQIYLLMEIWIDEECTACILYVVSIWCVGYASDRLNSGWGVVAEGHALCAALVFIVGFYYCPWSSVRTHSYAMGMAMFFYRWVSEHSACRLTRGPLAWFYLRTREKKKRNEVQRFNQT